MGDGAQAYFWFHTPGGAWGIKCGVGDQIQVNCAQGKRPTRFTIALVISLFYFSLYIMTIDSGI